MEKSNYISDLDKLAQQLKDSPEKPKDSVKRKADEISTGNSNDTYADANKELRELYLARRQQRENNTTTSATDANKTNEKIMIDMSSNIRKAVEKFTLNEKVETPVIKNIETKVTVVEETKEDGLTAEDRAIFEQFGAMESPAHSPEVTGGLTAEDKAIFEQWGMANSPVMGPKRVENASANNYSKDPVMWINKLRHYPPDALRGNMITFKQMMYEDMLRGSNKNPPKTLQAAFMTTFGYSGELLEPLLQAGVKLTLADEWSDIKEKRIEYNYSDIPNFTLIRSPKDASRKYTGAFHPKLWLLKFPTFLRIVISSGNLTVGDWTIWSNCLWYKDFPKISCMIGEPEKKPVPAGEFDFDQDFSDGIKAFTQALMPTKDTYQKITGINIDEYFISEIDIILIASLPGRHMGNDIAKFGHARVGSVLKQLNYHKDQAYKDKRYTLSYQTSSVGSLDEKFLREICSSFLPNYLTPEELKAMPKGKNQGTLNFGKKPSSTNINLEEKASERVSLIFPTKEYAKNCLEGPEYTGCLILNPGSYNKPTFCKDIFYKFEGSENYAYNEGIIPHLKVWVVKEDNKEIDDDGYIYIGSHNFSPSAWGRYEKDCSQISISNTELGVIFPPGKGTKAKKQEMLRNLPFRFPARKYGNGDEPWIISNHSFSHEE